ncbi:MAG: hypothetical protein CMM46_14480 [Rhodospirillaceae bacterium]|nr:hypothetical protein [Rhodospirillaceae bacterium]|tara:strand:- start:20816 stop:21535 length:720 start_codon:yes stop_codon:yes gene_type:complete
MAVKPEALTTSPEETISADRVAEYLARHPDFLVQYPELVDVLEPPQRALGDNVQDLQAHMIQRLRDDAAASQDEQAGLVDRTRRDRSLQDRIHAAALAMIGAVDLDHLVEITTSDLAILLGVDVVTLAVETACSGGQARVTCGVRCVVEGTVGGLMRDDRDVIIRSPAWADEILFKGASTLVASEVLARFGGENGLPCGVLAFGSRHDDHFQAGHPVDLYRFLVQVLDRSLRKKLGLPL